MVALQKPRPLALRTVPPSSALPGSDLVDTIPHSTPFLPSTLTPTDSSEDDDDGDGNLNAYLCDHAVPLEYKGVQFHHQHSSSVAHDQDTAMELDARNDLQPAPHGDHLNPWPFSGVDNGNVQPSPVWCRLLDRYLHINEGRTATPVDGHVTMESEPMAALSRGDVNAGESERASWKHHRRLPSPVSEDGGSAGNEGGVPIERTTKGQSPAGKTKPAKGKTTLSMGYRADCEKCQRRVPGHYSHWNRS